MDIEFQSFSDQNLFGMERGKIVLGLWCICYQLPINEKNVYQVQRVVYMAIDRNRGNTTSIVPRLVWGIKTFKATNNITQKLFSTDHFDPYTMHSVDY